MTTWLGIMPEQTTYPVCKQDAPGYRLCHLSSDLDGLDSSTCLGSGGGGSVVGRSCKGTKAQETPFPTPGSKMQPLPSPVTFALLMMSLGVCGGHLRRLR